MKFKTKLIIYLAFISIMRLMIFFLSSPLISPDIESYVELATNISNLDFKGFNGLRTPGYPLIIVLSGFNLKITVLIQLVFGIAISYLIADIVYKYTKREYLSLVASSIYSVFVPFLFFEISILSETTAAFFVLLSFVTFIKLVNNNSMYLSRSFLISCFTLLALLTRPIYMLMVPLYFINLIFVFKANNLKLGQTLRYMVVFIVPILIVVAGWSYINIKYNGIFSLATGRGFATMEMAGDYIEIASNDYPYNIIKEVYIRERDNNIRYGVSHIDTIWGITYELQAKTGLSYNELSEEVRKMCTEVMLKKPEIYIKSVISSEINFWKTFGILFSDNQNTNSFIKNINIVQRVILILIEILFLIAPIVYKIKKINTIKREIVYIFSFVYILIVGISVAIAVIECSEGRFAMPTFPLLIIATIILYNCILRKNEIESNLHNNVEVYYSKKIGTKY